MSVSGLSKIDKRLISVAAAIAAGCKPCTAVAIGHARQVGAPDEEIKRAVTIGLEVKRWACSEMQQEAQKHLDIIASASFPYEIDGKTKADLLMATSAAFAANFTIGFERTSAAAEKSGATGNEIKMAVEIDRHVKEQASIQVEKMVASVIPGALTGALRKEAVVSECGCAPSQVTKH